MAMKAFVLFFISACIICTTGFAQDSFKRNTVYGEFLGAGGLVSVNFDHRLGEKPDGFGFRTGIGYFQWNNSAMVTFPVFANYLLGNNGKYLDLGIGAQLGYEWMVDENHPSVDQISDPRFRVGTPIFNIGYRYQPVNGGFNFRIGFSPYMNIYRGRFPDLFWMPHLSMGYTF
jgi:hypothetical protein